MIKNNDDQNFIIFNAPLKELEHQFESKVLKAIKLRDVKLEGYITSGYINSEINSSLRAEGVYLSRKIVDQILKNKISGTELSSDEITKLISNYYDGLIYIISNNKITKRNMHTLYSLLTSDLGDIIEDESFYRKNEVSIGIDKGIKADKINSKMNELISFIESDSMEDRIQTKAIIVHYIFENIHPYYDYNGRMGRLLHLWILINNSRDEFWKLIFLSESIYACKTKLDSTYGHILKAKKNKANIDLTYFVGRIYEIFIDHTSSYLKMKSLVSKMEKTPSRRLRLFIIDILTTSGEDEKWYNIIMFKQKYEGYSQTVYDRVLKEIKESGLFDIQTGKPIRFKLKNNTQI